MRRLLAVLLSGVAAVAVAAGVRAAVTPSVDGKVEELELSASGSGPSIVAVAPDGSVWASLARASRILRVSPAGDQTTFELPEGAFPVGLLVDPEGVVWFTDIRHNQVVRLDPATGDLVPYDVPTPDSWPFFLQRDSAGRLYFTERVGNKLGRLDPRDGTFEEFEVATPHAQPAGMIITPDGHLFFTQNSANRVGHFDPEREELVDVPVPSPASPGPYYGPAGISSDAEGNVWFAELDGRLGLIRKESRDRVEEVALPEPRVRPGGVAVDAWGLVWYTGLDGNMIGSYDPDHGVFRRYDLPSGAADAQPMAPPEISARGEVARPGMAARSTRPFGIAAHPDGRIWFAEQYGHRLGYVVPPALDVVAPAGPIAGPRAALAVRRRGLGDDWRLSATLDGDAIATDGGIDLSRVDPGVHRVVVEAAGPGGEILRDAAEIVLRPSLATLTEVVAEWPAATEQVSAALGEVARQRTPGARVALRRAARELAAAGAPISVQRQVRFVEMFGRLVAEVELGDAGCGGRDLQVEVGDAVAWRRIGDGEPLRVAARDGSFLSPPLGSGGRWEVPMRREGTHEVLCDGGEGMKVTVTSRMADLEEFPMPASGWVPTVLAFDETRDVWFAAGGGGYASLADVPLNNRVGRFERATGVIHEFVVPTPESAPTSLKLAPDGSVWFTLRAASKIGRLDRASGKIVEYEIPTPDSQPTGLAVSPEGMVWFTEKKASKVGRFDPRTETFHEIVTPHENGEPSTVVLDHEGAVWFDERGADVVNRMDPASGEITSYRIPTKGSRVIGLVPDPRGAMWFLELGASKVGRIDVATGQVVEYAIPTPFASPFKAALDHHGRLWFTQVYGNKVGVLYDGEFFEFALAEQGAMPGGIEIDADGSVWMTQQAADKLARLPLAADVYAPLGPEGSVR